MRTSLVLALIFLTGFAVTAEASGENYTGLKIGMVSSGDVDVDGTAVDLGAGWSFGAFFDHPIGSRIHLGVTFDMMNLKWTRTGSEWDYTLKERLLDLGLCAKVTFTGEESDLIVRPGAGLGLGVMPKLPEAGLAASSYLTLKGMVEVAYDNGGDVIYLIEAGLWYAPSGGDEYSDVTIGPLLQLRAGVMF